MPFNTRAPKSQILAGFSFYKGLGWSVSKLISYPLNITHPELKVFPVKLTLIMSRFPLCHPILPWLLELLSGSHIPSSFLFQSSIPSFSWVWLSPLPRHTGSGHQSGVTRPLSIPNKLTSVNLTWWQPVDILLCSSGSQGSALFLLHLVMFSVES